MKHTEEYRNRYGDVFVFTYQPEENIIFWQVKNGTFDYCRYGWENDVDPNDNRYNMVDPSGGPYVSSGMDAKFVIGSMKDLGLYVDYMSLNGRDLDKILSVNIHLKPQPK